MNNTALVISGGAVIFLLLAYHNKRSQPKGYDMVKDRPIDHNNVLGAPIYDKHRLKSPYKAGGQIHSFAENILVGFKNLFSADRVLFQQNELEGKGCANHTIDHQYKNSNAFYTPRCGPVSLQATKF